MEQSSIVNAKEKEIRTIGEITYLYRMKLIRKNIATRLFLLVWCAVFLNMSFFMAEVSALKLTHNKALIENIKKLISSTAAEEETDSTETSEETSSLKEYKITVNEVYCIQNASHAVANQLKALEIVLREHPGHCKTYSPPPDPVNSFSNT